MDKLFDWSYDNDNELDRMCGKIVACRCSQVCRSSNVTFKYTVVMNVYSHPKHQTTSITIEHANTLLPDHKIDSGIMFHNQGFGQSGWSQDAVRSGSNTGRTSKIAEFFLETSEVPQDLRAAKGGQLS
jgi:hypothetical protein